MKIKELPNTTSPDLEMVDFNLDLSDPLMMGKTFQNKKTPHGDDVWHGKKLHTYETNPSQTYIL